MLPIVRGNHLFDLECCFLILTSQPSIVIPQFLHPQSTLGECYISNIKAATILITLPAVASLCSMTSSVSLSPTIVAPSAKAPALSCPIHPGLILTRSQEIRKPIIPLWRLQTHPHHTPSVCRSQSSYLRPCTAVNMSLAGKDALNEIL
jgi:hypothetical protein